MEIFAEPTVRSMFANITCIAKVGESDEKQISKMVKIAMPPSVIMELKASKLICNSEGHPLSDIVYYDTEGIEVKSEEGKFIFTR